MEILYEQDNGPVQTQSPKEPGDSFDSAVLNLSRIRKSEFSLPAVCDRHGQDSA
jgi:hypothetical protein